VTDPGIAQILATGGILGPILVVLWLAYGKLQKKLEDVQDKRVADADAYAQKMLEVATAIRENTAVVRELLLLQQQRG